jgi:predicted DCC family thiol-disulfide oxidoreductase YuxK
MTSSLHKHHMDRKSFIRSSPAPAALHQEVRPRPHSAKPYPLTLDYDGKCPVCRREIDLMKKFNRKDHLHFIDFSNSSFPAAEPGLNQCDLGRAIHARKSDGTLITGVEVFKEMWEGVGLGFLIRCSRRPIFNKLSVIAYAWFAKNRLRLTGRA